MSELRLHNTLNRRVEPFVPLKPAEVSMYCCGPTVYNFVHIGNLRTFLWSDLLRRYLEWKGYRVTMVMNFTDVDDRIINKAMERGIDIGTYCAPYVDAFYKDIETLRIRRATIHPRATEHIPEMVEIVEKLAANGHTYVSDGSTYFRITTLPDYGKLSQIEAATESAFSRIDSDNYDKQDARDFVLWKARKEGEPWWPSPMGEGRPGWHLECSAMSMRYLGETFDIHTGAVDLIFPHHENEIAQSEGATHHPFVRHWVHGEHLIVDAQKMSKSLGNQFTLGDLLEQGHSPLQLRYALLSVPYRTKLNFTDRSIADAKSALERLELFMIRLREIAKSGSAELTGMGARLAADLLRGFEEAMDDDLNTAAALGALFTMIREANIAMNAGGIVAGDAATLIAAIERIDSVFDILPRAEADLDAEIESMIQARLDARKRRDFKESDRLRDELLARGIILEDTPGGTRWRRK
ncbi:MAG: cysteine--tRNA ligase [Thermoanaerobaculia bacterium]